MKKFKPQEGQVDFTNIRYAPVINCVLKYKDKILILQRSKNLRSYPNLWSGVAGFLDDNRSIDSHILEEISEETGLTKENILSIKRGQVFDQEAPEYGKTWIVHPVLVEVNTDRIKIDWESKKFKWIASGEIGNFPIDPGFDVVVKELTH